MGASLRRFAGPTSRGTGGEERPHEPPQLLRVREKAVVADLDVEVGIRDALALAQHRGGEGAALALAEEPVARNGDDEQP